MSMRVYWQVSGTFGKGLHVDPAVPQKLAAFSDALRMYRKRPGKQLNGRSIGMVNALKNRELDAETGSRRVVTTGNATAEPNETENWLPAGLPRTPREEELFVSRLRPLILKFVRAYLPKRESEEDMVQMVFVKIFTKFSQYSGEVPLVHWVYRISVNTCLNQISREKKSPERRHADLSEGELDHLTFSVSDESAINPSASVEQSDYLATMMTRIRAEDRALLKMLYLEGHSMEEASRLTGSSVAAVKVRAFRARAKLRRLASDERSISA
jgi:RNA polymerase sigma-70 factor, ECF subfamily